MQRGDLDTIFVSQTKANGGKIVGMATVKFTSGLTLTSLRIINGANGLFVGMPKKTYKSEDKKYPDDVCFFQDKDDRQSFNDILVEEYRKKFGSSSKGSSSENEYNFGGPEDNGPF